MILMTTKNVMLDLGISNQSGFFQKTMRFDNFVVFKKRQN